MSAAPVVVAPAPAGAILVARGAMGSDAAGVRGAARGAVLDLSLALGRGVHGILGAPEDGSLALGDLVAGRIAPSRGTLTIGGRSPARDASVRKRVAHLAHLPDLPDARDVARCMDVAQRARGGGDPRAMLERIGAKQLLGRRLATLTHGEARAVDAALAFSAPSPLVVVAHEPFADVGPAASSAVEAVLRDLAAEGAAVLLITSSPRDAARVADDVLVLDRGRFVRGGSAGGGDLLDPPQWPYSRPRRAELLAQIAGTASADATDAGPARAIARRLMENQAVTSVTWEEPPLGERGPSTLRIAGPDEAACALALLDAADVEGAAIVGLAPVPATLVEVRMATDQLRIAATWHARMQALTTADAMTLAPPEPPAAPQAPPELEAVEAAFAAPPIEVEEGPGPSDTSPESGPRDPSQPGGLAK